MTAAGILKHWNYIVAFKNGTPLQFKKDDNSWKTSSNPTFSEDSTYRFPPGVTPNYGSDMPRTSSADLVPQPRTRVLNTEEMLTLVGSVIKEKGTGDVSLVIGFESEEGALILGSVNEPVNATELRDNFERQDGTPFSVEL